MNTTSPSVNYQASRPALLRASLAAGAGASAILLLFVLPAEYGIDPTGAGKLFGLTAMAEGEEGFHDATEEPDISVQQAAAAITVPDQTKERIVQTAAFRSDERKITLAPHSDIEIKARMAKGNGLVFQWSATGPLRMDMHGEPKQGKPNEFSTYWKQKDLTEAQGTFTAPFEGTHGWYLRNGGETPVSITLKTTGFYQELFEPSME